MRSSGEGRYRVWLKKQQIGDDILLILGGGEKSHIGSMVLCEPGKPTQVMKVEGHYDDVVLRPLAEATCQKHKKTVVAVGGIHINHATKEEITILINNCHTLIKDL